MYPVPKFPSMPPPMPPPRGDGGFDRRAQTSRTPHRSMQEEPREELETATIHAFFQTQRHRPTMPSVRLPNNPQEVLEWNPAQTQVIEKDMFPLLNLHSSDKSKTKEQLIAELEVIRGNPRQYNVKATEFLKEKNNELISAIVNMKQALEVHQRAAAEAMTKFEEQKKMTELIEQRIQAMQQERTRLKDELDGLRAMLEALQRENQRLNNLIDDIEKEKAQLKIQLHNLNSVAADAMTQTVKFEDEKRAFGKMRTELQDRINDLVEDIKVLENVRGLLMKQVEEAGNREHELLSNIVALQKEKDDWIHTCKRLQGELEQLKPYIAMYEEAMQKYDGSLRESAGLVEQLRGKDEEVVALKQMVEALKRRIATQDPAKAMRLGGFEGAPEQQKEAPPPVPTIALAQHNEKMEKWRLTYRQLAIKHRLVAVQSSVRKNKLKGAEAQTLQAQHEISILKHKFEAQNHIENELLTSYRTVADEKSMLEIRLRDAINQYEQLEHEHLQCPQILDNVTRAADAQVDKYKEDVNKIKAAFVRGRMQQNVSSVLMQQLQETLTNLYQEQRMVTQLQITEDRLRNNLLKVTRHRDALSAQVSGLKDAKKEATVSKFELLAERVHLFSLKNAYKKLKDDHDSNVVELQDSQEKLSVSLATLGVSFEDKDLHNIDIPLDLDDQHPSEVKAEKTNGN